MLNVKKGFLFLLISLLSGYYMINMKYVFIPNIDEFDILKPYYPRVITLKYLAR